MKNGMTMSEGTVHVNGKKFVWWKKDPVIFVQNLGWAERNRR